MTSNSAPDQPPKPMSKRSLFNKPAWSKPIEKAKEDPADIFFRSKEVYSQILKEDDRRLQKKAEKRAKADRRSDGSNKRRRSNSQSDRENLKEINKSSSEEGSDDQLPKRRPLGSRPGQFADKNDGTSRRPPPPPPPDDAYKPRASSKLLAGRYEKDVTERAKVQKEEQTPFGYIVVSEDEDDDVVVKSNSPNSHRRNASSSKGATAGVDTNNHSTSTSDAEEEFPELVRKAREKARLKALGVKAGTPEPTAQSEGIFSGANAAQTRPTKPTPDAVVSILITSRLANTKPLIVNRKIGQRLKDVRITWCHRQGFDGDQTEEIRLTWKGRRVYDMTTCKNLGITVDTYGNATWEGYEDGIVGSKEVHMEAMTDAMLREIEKTKLGSFSYCPVETNEQGIGGDAEMEIQPKADEARVKLVLKSQGYEDKSLTVRPDTTMKKIINAFRTARNVPVDKRVFLQFDGENLDPEVTVAETELSDMDYVDVYVK